MTALPEPAAVSADLAWLPMLLQTTDALFPTGAYAHSLGFEEAVRLGMANDEASLLAFLLLQILPAQRAQELPYLRFAFAAADLKELCSVDREISAWKLATETREASVQLGRRRLKALELISSAPELRAFSRALEAGQGRGHHLIACALQARISGVPLGAALAAYYYQSLAAICAAALKLMRIGQAGCQRALREAAVEASSVIAASLQVRGEDAGWFNPMLEIAAMRHARAAERLFIS